jgi:hypothetical protein
MSVLDDYDWPGDYPKGVPPEDSFPADGFVYRAVTKIPPDDKDFMMTREESPRSEYETEDKKAKSYGVSFFKKREKLEEKMRKYKPLGEKVIAQGELDKSLGVISKPNRQSHVTLWKCVNSQPSQYINSPAR